MNITTSPRVTNIDTRVSGAVHSAQLIPVIALGLALSLSFVITYVLCVIGYLAFPSLPIEHSAHSIFLPGLTLLTWSSFFLGLIEAFGWGWYIALIFGPICNFFAARS